MTIEPNPFESIAQDFMVIQQIAIEGETFALANNHKKAQKALKDIDAVMGMAMSKLEKQEGVH